MAIEERFPMTVEQRRLLNQDLAEIRGRLDDVLTLVRACYEDTANVRIRAEESLAALQRLEWALEREHSQK